MKILLSMVMLLVSMSVFAGMGKVKTISIVSAATATGAGTAFQPLESKRTFHGVGSTSAGAGAATIGIEVSNNGTDFIEVDELSLTLATADSSGDLFYLDAPYRYVRGNVKTISGTGASVDLIMGVQW